jgi:hypothetical protein
MGQNAKDGINPQIPPRKAGNKSRDKDGDDQNSGEDKASATPRIAAWAVASPK